MQEEWSLLKKSVRIEIVAFMESRPVTKPCSLCFSPCEIAFDPAPFCRQKFSPSVIAAVTAERPEERRLRRREGE
jgi:hypothetical protein